MKVQNGTKSAAVRARIGHPIIDTDGHTVELTPVFFDYLREIGGGDMVERYKTAIARRATCPPSAKAPWIDGCVAVRKSARARPTPCGPLGSRASMIHADS